MLNPHIVCWICLHLREISRFHIIVCLQSQQLGVECILGKTRKVLRGLRIILPPPTKASWLVWSLVRSKCHGIIRENRWTMTINPWRIHGAAICGVPWIPSIYPIYVSIDTSTMDPMGDGKSLQKSKFKWFDSALGDSFKRHQPLSTTTIDISVCVFFPPCVGDWTLTLIF